MYVIFENIARTRFGERIGSNAYAQTSRTAATGHPRPRKPNLITSVCFTQLLQLPDTKLVKSRGSWPGPGLSSMRTLESVCPEMSRSEQYLSPPAYGFANKQICSSETCSNGTRDDAAAQRARLSCLRLHVVIVLFLPADDSSSKDEPDFNDGQSLGSSDVSLKTPNHVP